MKIILSKKHLLLTLFLITALVYLYAKINNLPMLILFSKPFVVPLISFYYLISVKMPNKLFLLGLFFAFCGSIISFFNFNGFMFIIISIGFFLLFVLINMILITEMIDEITTNKFYKIIMPLVLALFLLYYISFENGGYITWLYYVFGGVIAIYASFSFYLYFEKRTTASLLNLIGVALFIFALIAKGVEYIDEPKVIYKLVNMILYPSFMFLLCEAFIGFGSDTKKELKL